MKNGTIDLVICPKCEAEIVVDVNEGEPTVPLSVLEEVLRGECFDWHFKDLMGRIKQKAGL